MRGDTVDRARQSGFTLTELIITIVVLAVLAVVSVPSFVELRERQALRGASDNFIVAVGLAKQEAIKRGEMVRVNFNAMGNAVCMGADVVAAADGAGCDCTEDDCAVARFPDVPGDTGPLNRVTLDGDIVFGDDGNGFVIDPRTGTLADITDSGGFVLTTQRGYQVRLRVNAMGRTSACTPDGAKILAGVPACD
jgi:type IV fimbrial biogenesis protein FimT